MYNLKELDNQAQFWKMKLTSTNWNQSFYNISKNNMSVIIRFKVMKISHDPWWTKRYLDIFNRLDIIEVTEYKIDNCLI